MTKKICVIMPELEESPLSQITVHQMIALSKTDQLTELQNEVKELKDYIEEVFADYNDINDDTRMQLELINQTLAELQKQEEIRRKATQKNRIYTA